MVKTSLPLSSSYQQLSKRYRKAGYRPGFQDEGEIKAYSTARMPATMAAVSQVLKELPLTFTPIHLLDLGAGTGAATLAALNYFPTLSKVTLIEQEPRALSCAQEIISAHIADYQEIVYKELNLQQYAFDEAADLVIFSYVLNELEMRMQEDILQKALATNSAFILIIMPGTPLCFQQLLHLRQQGIEKGYFIQAPCPHLYTCPMANASSDWCHFKVRLSRTKEHQVIKEATLNYEDEKFCYLLLSRDPISSYQARIVKNPLHRSGHSLLDVCEEEGLNRHIIGRKDKDIYKKVSKLKWGDKFEENK